MQGRIDSSEVAAACAANVSQRETAELLMPPAVTLISNLNSVTGFRMLCLPGGRAYVLRTQARALGPRRARTRAWGSF
jgi:hypothetical protein